MRDKRPLEPGETPKTFRFDIDIPALLQLLFRRRRLIAGVVGTVGVLAAVMMLMTPNRYTSSATILPSGKTDNFSALKAMAGLAGALHMGDENSSALYPVVLNSNLVRDSVLAHYYNFQDGDETVCQSLAAYIGKDNPDRLRHALSSITSVSANTRTGEITVAVETEHPDLSQQVVEQYLRQLENYNLYSRRSEARERVRYLSREVDTRRESLAESEDSLRAFQSRNRNWAATSDPGILMQLGRLKRDVEIKSQTLAYLLQESEAARLDAQKDVPVVRILDQASLPTVKSGPHRTVTVLGSAAMAFVLVLLAILGFDLTGQLLNSGDSSGRDRLRRQLAEAFPRTNRLYGAVRQRLTRETISVDSAS